MKNIAEKVWKNKMQHVKCDETILKTVKKLHDTFCVLICKEMICWRYV